MIRLMSFVAALLFVGATTVSAQTLRTCGDAHVLKCETFCSTQRQGADTLPCLTDCSRRLQACLAPGSYFWLRSAPTTGLRQDTAVAGTSGKPQTCGDEAARCNGYCRGGSDCLADCSIRLKACVAPDGHYYWSINEAFTGLQRTKDRSR